MERVKRLVHAHKVYQLGYTGKNIKIVVLDTGIFLHRDIRANVIGFKDFVGGKNFCYDDNGHGTHVAGILCGNGVQKGMAPGAQMIALKVLDQYGGGNASRVLTALDWVKQNHRRYGIRILNFSVGFLPGAGNQEQKEIIDRLEELWDENVVIVTAAGNNGPTAGSVAVPGISRKVITVGASDDQNPGMRLPQNYSGKGPTVCCIVKPEILAPGTNVMSLDHHGGRYVKKSGTSMATPVVSGALALALEKKPFLRPEELKLKLYDSVERASESRGAWGVLDVDNLIDLI